MSPFLYYDRIIYVADEKSEALLERLYKLAYRI
jgi:hypothetical protein